MFAYSISPGANVATNATANTLTDHLRTASGASRTALFNALYLIGKGAGLTAISGISVELNRYATPSTLGTAITPRPRDPDAQAAVLGANTAPSRGTTATLQLAVGCGAAGPGGWVAPNPDAKIVLEAGGGAQGNADLESKSGTVSLNFEYTLEHEE